MDSIENDRGTLAHLYDVTGGNNWTNSWNWNTDANLSEWHGIMLNDQGRVTEIRLLYNNLQGPIPKELGALAKLEVLNLFSNQLSGHIPAQLGDLGALKHLYLNYNKLDGPIPGELGALTKLEVLELNGNQLSGHIPAQLGDLGALKTLYLDNNKLDGFWQPLEQNQTGAMAAQPGTLPQGLEYLLQMVERLGYWRYKGNPWQYPPESIVEGGIPAVREYFEALYQDGTTIVTRPLKVVIVGKETVGKTSLRLSIKAGEPRKTQAGGLESTVHVDVEDHVLDDDFKIRIFDCAGQVVYYGLLQLFLTPRAVYLLVWDAEDASKKVWAARQASGVHDQYLEDLAIAPWLRHLTFRVPDANVVLVGNKWDGVAEAKEDSLGSQVEDESRQWLKAWIEKAHERQPQGLTLEDGVCRVSCAPPRFSFAQPWFGPGTSWPCDRNRPGLLHRIMCNPAGVTRAISMSLPLSYGYALDFLEKESRCRRAAGQKSPGMTREALEQKWLAEVEELKGVGKSVAAPRSAMSGAMLIRRWEGGLVEYGSYVFLDVQWFAEVLDPLLSHRRDALGNMDLGGLTVKTNVASLERLDKQHILEPRLAKEFWGADLAPHLLTALKRAGLTFPLPNDPNEGLVVLLRMKSIPPPAYEKKLKEAIQTREYNLKLAVRCKFSLGLPPGFIERTLAQCCQLGFPHPFWRYGALIVGDEALFSASLGYSENDKILTIQVHGGCGKVDAWAALSKILSVLVKMLSEFPGLPCQPHLFCPLHEEEGMIITTRDAQPGSRLVEESHFCSLCLRQAAGREFLAAALQVVEFSDANFDDEQLLNDFAENAKKVTDEGREPWLSSISQAPNAQSAIYEGSAGDTPNIPLTSAATTRTTPWLWYADVRSWIAIACAACLGVFAGFIAKEDDDPRLWGAFLAVAMLLLGIDLCMIFAKNQAPTFGNESGGAAVV